MSVVTQREPEVKTLVAVVVTCIATTVAVAFFEPAVVHPAARPTTCTLEVTWSPDRPEEVALRDLSQVGTLGRCRDTEQLAVATMLVQLARMNTPGLQP